jgi:capsular exopolysaccharide synthesis family protein
MPDLNSRAPDAHLTDYWRILVRRRWIVIAFFVICVATVAAGTFYMTPLYRAMTSIIVEGENTNVLRAEESAALGSNLDIYESYLETQMALIRSKSIAGKVFEEFKLSETPRYQKREGLGKFLERKFVDDIYLERIPATRMIMIAVENPDPKMAADIANRLAQVYTQDNLTRRALSFIRNQRMASLNADFLRLQAKLDGMSNQLGPRHPDMIALREEIRTTSERIKKQRFGGQESGGGNQTSEDQILLEDALLKIQENSVLSSSRMSNAGVVDEASPPKEIAKPKWLLNIALAVIAGLAGGVLLAFFIEYIDDTIKTDEDLRKNIGKTALLGHLRSENGFKGKLPGKHSNKIDRLVSLQQESPSAEAYRLIRTRILWSIPRDESIKDIVILSPGPSEGKTTIVSNLGIALAQLKLRVLLVDTDMRRGRLHEPYGLSNDKGLGQYLTGDTPMDDVIQKTEIPNLSIVTCGQSVIDSSQLLGSPRMTQFITEARKRYDIILYDTPPVTIISDASILMSQIHAAILTVRSGYTNSKNLVKAMSIIKDANANLLGLVMNAVNSTENTSYYYKYYQRS